MITEKNLVLAITIMFIVGFIFGANVEKADIIYPTNQFAEREINLAAVDTDGNGVAVPLKVEIKYGTGKVLTDIDKLLFWVDTQYSIQTARNVAENITGIDTNSYDIVYSIESNDTGVIGGPSAGAALTVATIAALEDLTIKNDVIMTGTINPDGTIGQVGGVLEKSKAAKDIGAKIFVVPLGQSQEINLIPTQRCSEIIGFIWCRTTYETETINVGKDAGIAVIEVENINQALDYIIE